MINYPNMKAWVHKYTLCIFFCFAKSLKVQKVGNDDSHMKHFSGLHR